MGYLQHARDAVFYWQQLNIGRFSPLVTSQKWHHSVDS
nr:MAG TPA: hypothetical protein [Caudoviricetes sp.]